MTGSTPWRQAVDDLAEALLAEGDLDGAIRTREEALAQVAELAETPGVVALRHNLGIDVMTRFRRRGDPADLRQACDIGWAVWSSTVEGERLDAAVNLAGRLAVLAHSPGEEGSLDQALRLLSDELAVSADDDDSRPLALSALAGIHLQRWQSSGDRAALEDGVKAAAEYVRLGTAGPEITNVAGVLSAFAEETSDADLLDVAESLVRRGLAAPRPAPSGRATLYRLLASILLHRYDRTGAAAALEEARTTADLAVQEAEPVGGVDLAQALSVRAAAQADAARAAGDRASLAEAIADARRAAEVARDTEPDQTEYLTNLAIFLVEMYDLVGDGEYLDESVELLDEALAAPPPADSLAAIANNQANNLRSRFERDGTLGDLDRGIELISAAIAATSPASAELSARHNTASQLYAARAHHHRSLDDLAVAEQQSAEAVRTAGEHSPDLALYLNNWAMWVTDRWEWTDAETALDEAIALLERAQAARTAMVGDESGEVLAATIAFNLGVRLQDRFEIALRGGRRDLPLLQRVIDQYDAVLAEGHPHLTVVAGKRLGDIAWRLSLWPEAEHSFRLALQATSELTGLRSRRGDKERARAAIQGIGSLAALSAARAGDRHAAAVHIEQASATLIAEAIGVRAEHVSFDGIAASAARMRRHLLLLGSTPESGIAVLVSPDGDVECVELPELTADAVAAKCRRFRRALAEAAAGTVAEPIGECRRATDDLAAWTAQALIDPVRPKLQGATRLAVLPLGQLAWLPITTAHGRSGSLTSLEPVLLIRAVPGQPVAAAEAGRADGPRRIVVWADTGPPSRPIPAVVREAELVAEAHRGAELTVDERSRPTRPAADRLVLRSGLGVAGPDAVDSAERLSRLLEADLVHLACHCDVDIDRPHETILQLQPPLRVDQQRPLSADRRVHVVLSACDAALTSATLPDEALSAATAFLLAGAGIVTAPLWPVSDAPAAAFMADYHRALAAGSPPSQALSDVQLRWALRHPLFVRGPWVITAWPDLLGDPDS